MFDSRQKNIVARCGTRIVMQLPVMSDKQARKYVSDVMIVRVQWWR